jgi:BlaI family penicillinase repressor
MPGQNPKTYMPKKNQLKPTAAELEILAILWDRETATVKEVHEVISARKPTAYTTVLKTMQIMTEKGLVEPDKSSKAHVYRPAQSQTETKKSLVTDLIEKVFRGSALRLVQHVLESKPASAQEIKEIRKMIREAEKKANKES